MRSDQHEVRVGQVAMTLERTGLGTVDFGTDSPRAQFAEAACADRGLRAAISALLPTMPSILAAKGMKVTAGFRARLGPLSEARPWQQRLPARPGPTRAHLMPEWWLNSPRAWHRLPKQRGEHLGAHLSVQNSAGYNRVGLTQSYRQRGVCVSPAANGSAIFEARGPCTFSSRQQGKVGLWSNGGSGETGC